MRHLSLAEIEDRLAYWTSMRDDAKEQQIRTAAQLEILERIEEQAKEARRRLEYERCRERDAIGKVGILKTELERKRRSD